MPVNADIRRAIEQAVRHHGQDQSLAAKIVAWFEAVTSGNEEIHDTVAAGRHLDLLYQQTKLEPQTTDANEPDRQVAANQGGTEAPRP